MDTIFAVSSGRPPAAIAVLRISGPDAAAAGYALAGSLPSPRHAALRTLRDANGLTLDRALCLWFPGPATATGEDLLEFHAHGGRAVISAIEAALASLPALRPAEPGEFTRRALSSGRIDLAEAQGLADLLAAETEQQRRASILASSGHLSAAVREWLSRLSAIGALIEAAIDFDDEDDVPALDRAAIHAAIEAIAVELAAVLARPPVESLRDGARIALAGPPNSGKSSLFNALLQRDAAIVSPIAGTTRDVIESTVMHRGEIYTFVDTAGIRDAPADPIERIGIERAERESDLADLVLWLGDTPPENSDALWLFSRCDLPERASRPYSAVPVSIYDRQTVDRLWEHISNRTRNIAPFDGLLFQRDQRIAIRQALDALVDDAFGDILLYAESVRHATANLGAILGVNATEQMLDALFSRFCVGK